MRVYDQWKRSGILKTQCGIPYLPLVLRYNFFFFSFLHSILVFVVAFVSSTFLKDPV